MFSISLTVFEIFKKKQKKTLFLKKKIVRDLGPQKHPDLGQSTFKIFVLTGNRG